MLLCMLFVRGLGRVLRKIVPSAYTRKSNGLGHTLSTLASKYSDGVHVLKRTLSSSQSDLLCGVNYFNSTCRSIPPTAGIRVLNLDGGGVRGVIGLEFLEHTERMLRKPCCHVREYFDFVCSTSTGKFLVFTMPFTNS